MPLRCILDPTRERQENGKHVHHTQSLVFNKMEDGWDMVNHKVKAKEL